MRALGLGALLALPSLWLSACSPAPASRAGGEEAVAAGGATPPPAGHALPNYRDELRRAAMRGLRYDGGRAVIVAEEAARIVSGPDSVAAEEAMAQGAECLARNAVLEAIAAHTKAVLLAPAEPRAYLALGDVLLAHRRADEALAAYRSGLELDPSSAALREGAGRALIGLGQRAEAVEELLEAVRIDPSRAAAFERLSIQLYYLGDDAAAWGAAHAAEALGRELPPQYRALLAKRAPEPVR